MIILRNNFDTSEKLSSNFLQMICFTELQITDTFKIDSDEKWLKMI